MRAPPDHDSKRFKLLGAVAAAVALIVAAVLLLARDDAPRGKGSAAVPPTGTDAVPQSIASDCSKNVQVELSSFINGVVDGRRVSFPKDGCYALADRIEVRDKSGLTIDGNGSTFRSSAANSGRRATPNWLILRGRDLRISDMKIVGNFHLTGERSQQRVNQISVEGEAGATTQPNAGIAVYGGDGIHISHMDIRDVFGDGVLTAVSEYIDHDAPSETPRDVHVEHVTVTKAARHCYSPDLVIGFWLEDSSGRDCWYAALDAELDAIDQRLEDVHILRNTFSDFNMMGIYVPVAGTGSSARHLEISDNRFLTYIDQPCNQIISVGVYPTEPNTFKDVVVERNSIMSHGIAIAFDHVEGGAIRDNKINFKDVGCAYPKKPPRVQVTNSKDVKVSGNGP
jgi:hypothetical protein